ncbi:MAG: LCP family protein [Mycobacterium sp.]|nr:LCP family protein [Mycobacterium sp.]
MSGSTPPVDAPGVGETRPRWWRGRHHAQRQRRAHGLVSAAKVLAALASVTIVVVCAIGWASYRNLSSGITTSQALADEPPSPGTDQNILIMGLDIRRDQQGRELPQDVYDALHAGDENSGEDDSDVLMVLHVPGKGGPITAISIPRDDYVDLPGCPTSNCRGKVKHAYSLAYEHVIERGGSGDAQGGARKANARDAATREQRAREAGRKAEITTVRRFLQIPIDHFIEVSLVAFFQIARVVEPITVCLDHDTSDPYYSGADFQKGVQEIDASQAMAFVRQRRDVNDEWFTDLDRTRRQQAFIASLVTALRHRAVLTNPGVLHHLLDVVKQNVAVDAGFDLAGFLQKANAISGTPLVLYTLPVIDFTQIADGQNVNMIDVPTLRSIVHHLIGGDSRGTAPPSSVSALADGATTTQTTAPGIVLNVVNAAGREGLAASLEKALATGKLTKGKASTAASTTAKSTILYGPGAQAAAAALGDELDLTATASKTLAPNTVQLTAGTDFRADDYLDDDGSEPSATPTTTVTTVAATPTGNVMPSPTNLTRMSANNVPCVK